MSPSKQRRQRNVPKVQDRLDRFLALRRSLPWTREFRNRLRKRTAKSLRQARRSLRELQAVDENTKDRIAEPIRRYERRTAEADFWRDAVFELLDAAFYLVVMLGFNVGVLYMTAQFFEIETKWWYWLPIWLVYFGLSSLSLIVVFWIPSVLMLKAPTYLRFPGVLLVWVAAVVGLCGLLIAKLPTAGFVSFIFASAAGGIIFIIAINLLHAVAMALLDLVLEQRRCKQLPDATLASQLLRALRRVETGSWDDLALKRDLLEGIEKAAVCMERYFPRQLRSRDRRTEVWLEDTAVQAAAALRELKRWVCFPTAGTREQFIERVAGSLVHIALGEWDDLERKKPEKLPRGKRSYALLIEPLKVLTVAGIGALVLYLGAPKLGLEPNFGWIAASGWVALTILGKLDPSLGEKIVNFKQLSGV